MLILMKVGFTGTQLGMTKMQMAWLSWAFDAINCEWEFHHGDCVGADAQAHEIAKEFGAHIVGHPPDNPSKRAFCDCDELWAEKPYLERNRDIVDECDVLIGMPKGHEEIRSGTWATIRYARKTGVKRRVVLPDGTRNEND